MIDRFDTRGALPWIPGVHAFDIAPSDADDLPHVTSSLYVHRPGDFRVEMASGQIVTLSNAGLFYSIDWPKLPGDGGIDWDNVPTHPMYGDFVGMAVDPGPYGIFLPIRVRRVFATGTTATGLKGFY